MQGRNQEGKGSLGIKSDDGSQGKQKSFFKCINSKKKKPKLGIIWVCCPNEVGALVKDNTKKVDLLNTCFSSVFIAKTGS